MNKLMIIAAGTFACAAPAMAQNVVGTTNAVFANPAPVGSTTTGTGTSTFTYGQADPTTNRLSFVGTPFASTIGTPFKVGTLSYLNGTTALGTTPNSVDLDLTLNFTMPNIPATTSDFTLDLVSTPNTGTANQNADYVYFPSSYSPSQFSINGTVYQVALTGFQNVVGDGFLASSSSEFHVREGGTASADLFAKVTAITSAVPEPGTWAMLILGFGLLGAALRRARKVTTRVSYAA